MFKQIIAQIQKLTRTQEPIDPSKFNDSLALETQWTPAKGGGASFCTRKLKAKNTYKVEFVPSLGAKLFYLIFFFVGVGLIFIMFFEPQPEKRFMIESLFPLGFGLIFSSIGGVLYYFGTSPIIFDRMKNMFWKGRNPPNVNNTFKSSDKIVALDKIRALQLLSERCSGNKGSFYSYELNLVLDNADRINVVDHGNLKIIKADADNLSKFLNVPVWDATH